MSQLRITQACFNDLHICCDTFHLSYEALSQTDMFLPILLLLVEQTVADKELMDKLVSYELKYKKESLFYIEASAVEIKNADVLINIITQMNGIQAMIHLLNLVETEDEALKHYDMLRLREYIKSQLEQHQEGQVLDKNKDFVFLFNHITTASLSKSFLKSQHDRLQSFTLFDQFDFVSDSPASDKKSAFVLADSYPQFNSEDKKIFDELAVLACANYLSENPKIASIVDIEQDKSLPVDERLLLAAVLSNGVILEGIARHLNCQPYQIVFTSEVYALREKLKLTATTRSFDFNSTNTTWYKHACKYAPNLQLNNAISDYFSASIENNRFNLDHFVSALIEQPNELIEAFLANNDQANNSVKTAITSQQIQQSLNHIVIGQEDAVNSLCQGYLTSSIEAQEGPRLIYTFAGPSGVGKTFLASQLQSQLNEFEKSGYVFNIFNMEQYADERDALKLFGSGIQYTDASLGMLTYHVRAQPRQVLLFDEIEKAHSVVIQSLLSILDSGVTKDQTSQEQIDFSQCIIIFTTNLGQDTLESNHQNSALSIFELLQHSENPVTKTKLSPEFINRLAKGFPVLFKALKVNHLLRLAEMQISKTEVAKPQIAYQWPDNFASLMLQSMSPDISVRALKSQLAKHKSMILNRAISYFSENTENVNFQISIKEDHVEEKTIPTQLLLLDDDSRVFELIKTQQTTCEVSLCSAVGDLRHAIESFHPDALLIDIDTLEKSGEPLSQIISDIFAHNDKTPIFSYQLSEQYNRSNKQSLAHEVREHFDIRLYDFASSFLNMLSRVDYYIDTEHKLISMKRRNEQLQYQCEVSRQDAFFQVNYTQLRVERLVQSADLKEGDLFKHSLPTLKLEDVVGLDRAKKRLVEVVNWLKSPQKLANFGIKVPSGFLFAGPPGTGKTFLAKALAGESGLPFFSVSSSELSESHSGGTTKNIKQLFATARKYAPAIIFIDEIDAIASKRSHSSQGADRDRNLTVNALLTEMDGFTPQSDPIFILAATNHPQLLDSAIVRPGRFDETIYCDLPNVNARKQFFTRFSAKHQIDFTQEELQQLISSSQGMSSAEIEQVFRESIYQAVGENRALTSDNIKQTMIRVCYGLPSDHIVLSQEEKKRTAYHEAGHLLLTKLLFPKQAIDFVTIEPRSNSLGFVATRAADEYESLSSIRVKHRLEVLLAGRIAEKIYTGSIDEVSSGASSDIDKATKLAMHVIYEGGLDASVGPVNVGLLTKFEESDLLLKAQTAVKNWLLDAEQSAEKRLIAHRVQLDDIAQALIEKESLIREEIESLFSSFEANRGK